MLKDYHIKLYKELKIYHNKYGYSPTIRELKDICNYKSTSTVHAHLKILEKAEYIEMGTRKSRSIRIF